nr:radical SAM protein [Thermococcus sp. M36]
MVSQLCNIKCKYCYAHSGTYNTPGIMKEGIGKRALDIASDLGVTSIQFYGGEPLTNFELISKLVEYGDKQGYSFKYGIITNGTLMDKEIGNFLKQHDFEVTISIDGPREINDLNRVYPTGKGTHDDILKAVDLLNELEVPLALEITYAP